MSLSCLLTVLVRGSGPGVRGGFIASFAGCELRGELKIKSKKKRKSKLETVPDTSSDEDQYGYVHNSVRQKFHSLTNLICLASFPENPMKSSPPSDIPAEFGLDAFHIGEIA